MTKAKTIISARDFLPKRRTIPALRSAAKNCQGCHLYKQATQTVFSEGSAKAPLMIVGEIPGEKEDELGEPFVGPAGILLRKTLEASGLDFADIYFTNVVKHFKFTYLNKRRMHRSPTDKEIKACVPWLDAEIEIIHPQIILCLGAIAAKTLLTKNFRITQQRGKWFKLAQTDINVLSTYHPSAILRAPSDNERHRMQRLFSKDIKKTALFLYERI